MQDRLQELKNRLREIQDLQSAAMVLAWDQQTYMPPRGAPARARRMATLRRIAQEKFIDPVLGKLLDDLIPYGETLPYDSDDAALIRVACIQYERAVAVPPQFMAEFNEHTANGFQIWAQARPENNFNAVRPVLEKTLDYTRRYAQYFPHEHIADPLIGWRNEGITTAMVRDLFAQLRRELVALLNKIKAQEPVNSTCLYQYFPKEQQYAFARQAIEAFGYDFSRGRLDETHHPFEIAFSINDVRLTSRVNEHHLGQAVFATMHEAGHGLYEQGIHLDYDGLILAHGTSSSVHESQSRLWENRVGRSREFWDHYYADLQALFPDQLRNTSVDAFYKAVNKVQPSLIRVEADEVTYNLHIMIRSDLSIDLLEGRLEIKDLPEAWNARYESDLGVVPPDNRDGVMQDVHWYDGVIGGSFEGYTMGNILSAQYYDAALKVHPDIPAQIARGEFGDLHNWLKENIWRHGRKYDTIELTERITGEDIRIVPLVKYLNHKFGELYNLSN